MTKQEFLSLLSRELHGLPPDDLQDRMAFYSDMIDDRMEDGVSETEAVAEMGAVSDIASQIIKDTPLTSLVKETLRPKRRLRGWETALLILSSPIWLSLGIAAAAVIVSLYVSMWAVIISLWAVFASLVGCALGGVAAGAIFFCIGYPVTGLAMIGAVLVLTGLSVFLFFGCKAASSGLVILTGKTALWMKNRMMKKEDA